MAKKSGMQIAKDWLVVVFCLSGLVFFVFASANHLSSLLSRPLAGAQNLPANGPPAPAQAKATDGPPAKTQAGPTNSELATLFSGASSLALIMFSLLLAFAAIIGWQSLRHDVETVKARAETILDEMEKTKRLSVRRLKRIHAGMTRRVENLESSMKKQYSDMEEELRGRVTAVMGNVIGTLHSDPTQDYQSEEDQAYLVEAVYHSKQGYERLEKLPGNKKYLALQNLVYYSSLLRVQSEQEKLLEWARELAALSAGCRCFLRRRAGATRRRARAVARGARGAGAIHHAGGLHLSRALGGDLFVIGFVAHHGRDAVFFLDEMTPSTAVEAPAAR